MVVTMFSSGLPSHPIRVGLRPELCVCEMGVAVRGSEAGTRRKTGVFVAIPVHTGVPIAALENQLVMI